MSIDEQFPASQTQRTIDPAHTATPEMYFLLNSLVVPRPIAWISTRDAGGRDNLAPHSYFTVAATDPPALAFTSIGDKDTVRNIRATGEFVVHMFGHDLAERMNVTSTDAPPGVSEFDLAGLTPVASDRVSPRRIAQAPVAIECTVNQIVDVGRNGRMVIGDVQVMHVAEHLWTSQDRIDPAELDAVGRMGGATYATTRDRFELRRPSYAELAAE